MSDASAVLRKKVAPARAAMPGGSSVAAMLRKVLPRVADKILSMDVLVADVRFGVASKAEVLEGLSEFDLIYLMEAGDELRGIASLTPGLLAALIEIQVSGRVSERDVVERPATKTDGIVAGDIIDRWLAAAKAAAEEEEIADALPTVGYSRSNRVLSIRNTDLSLDPGSFKTVAIELSVEGGAKTGVLSFALPPIDDAADDDTSSERMRAHLAQFEAPMVAILARMPVPIETVKNLAIDDVIDVPISSLLNVQIEGLGGQKITTARLGQLNGAKAVRLLVNAEAGDEDLGLPLASGLGNLADAGGIPALPDPAGLPPADPSGLTDMPMQEPSMPDAGGLPDLPDLPVGDTGGDFPELPALDPPGDLPDLPDLPELPSLDP